MRRCPLRVGLPRSQTPTRLGANGRLGGWDKYGCTSFLRYFGLVGPSRPRRDPRPARSPGAGLDANITSRCKRSFSSSTRPVACGAALRGALRQAARSSAEVQAALREARASSITKRSAGSLARGSRQARCPARAMAASHEGQVLPSSGSGLALCYPSRYSRGEASVNGFALEPGHRSLPGRPRTTAT